MPKISVIVPVYNVQDYLLFCLDSVMTQSFTDFEVIIVDDESQDSSLSIARGYAERDERIKVFSKKHLGLGNTRNEGLLHASGEYILFVDSDDWIERDLLEKVYNEAIENDSDLVFFNYVRESGLEESEPCIVPAIKATVDQELNERLLDELVGPSKDYTGWRITEMLGSSCRRLFKLSLLKDNDIKFLDEREILLEDHMFTTMSHFYANNIVVMPDVFYHYRYNPYSLTTKYHPKKLDMYIKYFELLRNFLTSEDVYDKYKKRHKAWFLRYAIHSCFLNCFSDSNKIGIKGRMKEIKDIANSPYVMHIKESDYFKKSSFNDRVITKLIKINNPFLYYIFYNFYYRKLKKSIPDNKN